MIPALRILVLIIAGFILTPSKVGDPSNCLKAAGYAEEIYVVKHTWHTGIICIRKAEFSNPVLNQLYEGAKFIEIGWGDFDFFRSDKATIGMAAKAMLWPTKSVLHIFPYYRSPENYFEPDKIRTINLSEKQYHDLLNYISGSFKLDDSGKIIPLDAENPVGGKFYLSVEKYHLFKTCNVWTARGLKEADLPIRPFFAFNSKNVIKQINRKVIDR
jgi:uncharacterized protein (TIGR02117 family)